MISSASFSNMTSLSPLNNEAPGQTQANDGNELLHEHIGSLEIELEELRERYMVSLQNVNDLQSQKDVLLKAVDELRQENADLHDKAESLSSVIEALEMQKSTLFAPAFLSQQHSEQERLSLLSSLTASQQKAKRAQSDYVRSREENEELFSSLQSERKRHSKEKEQSEQRLSVVSEEARLLRLENEALKKELFRCELDLNHLAQRLEDREDESERIKARSTCSTPRALGMDAQIGLAPYSPEDDSCDTEAAEPCFWNVMPTRKKSITMCLNDLASVIGLHDDREQMNRNNGRRARKEHDTARTKIRDGNRIWEWKT